MGRCLIGLVGNGFGISKLRSVGAFMLVVIFLMVTIHRRRFIMAILWRRMFIVAIFWRRLFIMAICRGRIFIMPVFNWWFIMPIFLWRRRFIMTILWWRGRFIVAIFWRLSILFYVITKCRSVHRDMVSSRFVVRLLMMIRRGMVMKKHRSC